MLFGFHSLLGLWFYFQWNKVHRVCLISHSVIQLTVIYSDLLYLSSCMGFAFLRVHFSNDLFLVLGSLQRWLSWVAVLQNPLWRNSSSHHSKWLIVCRLFIVYWWYIAGYRNLRQKIPTFAFYGMNFNVYFVRSLYIALCWVSKVPLEGNRCRHINAWS